jgi:phosphoenolpyruvate phosphomutase
MKAIILAAGPSSRLVQLTDDKPKCMLDVGGKTILQWQLDAFRQCGINDFVVIRGYMKDKINYPGIKYIYNWNYRRNNILESLMYAEGEMDDEFMVSYSDILYNKSTVEKLLKSKADVSLIVDTDWRTHYVGRTLHPTSEAEKVVIEGGKVAKIGKKVSDNEAYGEYIGLAKFSKSGAQALRNEYARIREQVGDGPFHDAAALEKAYLTDIIQEMIDRGYDVVNVDIKGGWIEIDTPQDLKRAEKEYSIAV